MKKTIKNIFIVLVVCFLFLIPISGMTLADSGIYNTDVSRYLYPSALDQDRDLKNFNSNTIIVLEFEIMFTGYPRQNAIDKITSAYNKEVNISDVIQFGDGLWYDSLEILSISKVTQTSMDWYSITNQNGYSDLLTARYRNTVKFRLTFTQSAGVPNLVQVKTDGTQILTPNQGVDLSVKFPWYNGSPFSCYCKIDSVSVSAPVGQRVYIPGGDGALNVYLADTFMQPFALARQWYISQNPSSIYQPEPTYENIKVYFNVSDSLVSYPLQSKYILDGEDGGIGKYPKFYNTGFKTQDTEFFVNSIEFVPDSVSFDTYPVYMELLCSIDGLSKTDMQRIYKPSAYCFTSFRYKNTVVITNDSNNNNIEYDVSQLYTNITFNIPEWGQGDNFGQNLGLFFVGILEALLTLVGNVAYNMVVWIACETPVLSTITKPLFVLGARTGGVFSKFFLPVITGLGILTPVIITILLINVIKKYSGV